MRRVKHASVHLISRIPAETSEIHLRSENVYTQVMFYALDVFTKLLIVHSIHLGSKRLSWDSTLLVELYNNYTEILTSEVVYITTKIYYMWGLYPCNSYPLLYVSLLSLATL